MTKDELEEVRSMVEFFRKELADTHPPFDFSFHVGEAEVRPLIAYIDYLEAELRSHK